MNRSMRGLRLGALFLAGAGFLGLASAAFGRQDGEADGSVDRPALQLAHEHVRAVPQYVALVNRRHELVGGWQRIDDVVIQEDCGASLCFDGVETNGENALNSRLADGYYGKDCGVGGSRWFLGRNYCNTLWANDFDMPPGCSDVHIGRVQHAWWWQVQGTGTRERCYIEFSFYENYSGCDGFDGFVSGVVLDFGELESSQGVGFYYVDLPLCRLPLDKLRGPADGAGVYAGAYYRSFGEVTEYATCAQPMLWGLNKPLHYATQSWESFDDVAPRDGELSFPDECRDYDTGVCPGPLGAATSFWRKGKKSGEMQITPQLRVKCLSATVLVARVKNVTPGELLTFELNGQIVDQRNANRKGKARSPNTVVRRVPYTVRVPEYFLIRNQICG
ncbi:MAG: hypothetical protein KJ057_05775 [Phycisphaerae bacterium]|nr:MAG: hypothetical protein EDS66_01310 [Planctomycetota bacterium]KAB2937655.1 MAG: hypothetical protein F9K17_16045 [Phycisphaerae bacterium]MBE7458055.1 hypothetical protein [Planctomycetia bacterium]MCK6464481.1 hypothetical protein [Phycisphaerae bacterium]MCL4717969.1 hypothetical protein [Phycisphaerae bacterium]